MPSKFRNKSWLVIFAMIFAVVSVVPAVLGAWLIAAYVLGLGVFCVILSLRE